MSLIVWNNEGDDDDFRYKHLTTFTNYFITYIEYEIQCVLV